MCIYNQMIKNRKYTKNKTNKGIVPTLPDRRVEYVPSKCGNCIECRKQKAREWHIRLMEHIKTNTNGKFITLTFSNESIAKLNKEFIKKKIGINTIYNIKTRKPKVIPTYEIFKIAELTGYAKDNAIATKALRLFNERWRKEYKTALKHWVITELGHNGTENIHMHGIIWTDEHIDKVREKWQYGYIWPRPNMRIKTYVNSKTASYMMKYVMKIDKQHKEYKPIILSSPGIGEKYIETRAAEKNMITQNGTYKTQTGHEIALPTYYRKKLYTEEDREEMWIKVLNKEERYVDGVKYDISKTENNYKKAVEQARQKNMALGYGGRTNENRKAYEEQRREIMTQTRIAKAQEKLR